MSESIFSKEKSEQCGLEPVAPIPPLPEIVDCDPGPVPIVVPPEFDAPPVDGCDGLDGKDAIDGADGQDGNDGQDGCDGVDGKDAIDGADGQDGNDGEDGCDGLDGKDAIDGADGQDGEDGCDGIDGKDAVDGADGQDGEDGPDGCDGIDGKDAVDAPDAPDGRDGIANIYETVLAQPYTQGEDTVYIRDPLGGVHPIHVPYPLTQPDAPANTPARFYVDLSTTFTVGQPGQRVQTSYALLDMGIECGSISIGPQELCTVVLPICRAINPRADGDWSMPFNNTYQTQHNGRTHFAAQCGYVAIDGKTYSPVIAFVDDEIVYYYKNLRVSTDVNILNGIPEGVTGINAHYHVEVLHRPIIVYAEENGNEWRPWANNFEWETTTDPNKAWKNYDIAACPTLDYSEVLVPGERVKYLRTEQHSFYKKDTSDSSNSLLLTSNSLVIVEPPAHYIVEFEGTSDALECGVWNKERMLTNNQADVVKTTIDDDFNIGAGTYPYDYWGFDTLELLPNGLASWSFIDIAAFPRLDRIQKPPPPEPEPLCECETPDPDIDGICQICGLFIDPPLEPPSPIDDTWPSRPILTDTVSISNTACNTHAYGLWYKTDRDGVRYPILCNVESLTAGTVIETRKVNCYVHSGGDCVPTWNIFKIKIEREGTRLLLPDVYCAVNCDAAISSKQVIIP